MVVTKEDTEYIPPATFRWFPPHFPQSSGSTKGKIFPLLPCHRLETLESQVYNCYLWFKVFIFPASYSFIHSFILSSFHSPILSFIHLPFQLFIHPFSSFSYSFIFSPSNSFVYSFPKLVIHSFIHFPIL